MSIKLFVLSGLLLSLPSSGAGKTVDFLVLEDPAALEILSRYEQALTTVEKKTFPPLAPVEIVEEKTVLGDGITPAMEVAYEGRAYFLIRRGWTDKPPAMRRHSGCRSEDDGEKRAGADIRCTRGPSPGGPSATIRAGEMLRTVFTCGTRTYVKHAEKKGAKAGYLWCPAGGPFLAEEKAPAIGGTGISPDMRSLLAARLESANAAYAQYTREFNRLTGESREPPHWDCSFSQGGMRCRLEGGLGSADLEKSTAILADELRNSLTGKPFDVTLVKGAIEVAPRNGKGAGTP